jgi:tetratricopeptide (TPR) repeat protein
VAHDVFISYASEDKTVADTVCALLERRKIRCWIAPRDVRPGVIYSEALIDALNSSRLLVLVFSSSSNNSPHVMREMEAVVSMGIPILPFRIEDIEPSKAIQYYIGSTHWLDALTPPLKKYLNYLADNVELLLRARDIVDNRIPTASAVSPEVAGNTEFLQKPPRFQNVSEFITARKQSIRTAMIVIAALLIIGAGAYALNGRMPSNKADLSQNTVSESGLPIAASSIETTSGQQTAQAGTNSPTSNQGSIVWGGIAESANLAQQASNLLMSNSDPQKVLEICNQAIEFNPNNDFAYETRGMNYWYNLHQLSQGFADIQKAIELHPEFGFHYVHRGQMYVETGYKDLAISDFKKGIELANDQTCINEATSQLKQLGVPGY